MENSEKIKLIEKLTQKKWELEKELTRFSNKEKPLFEPLMPALKKDEEFFSLIRTQIIDRISLHIQETDKEILKLMK